MKQWEITLGQFSRGVHLVTKKIEESISIEDVDSGLCHILLLHTSASLTLNENADPSVRVDFSTFFDRLVPDGYPGFVHTIEGDDDMPAHIKSSLLGVSIMVPVTDGRFNLGTWQGIYLYEHRNNAGIRKVVATIIT